jgi:hypothetical protein
MYILNCAAFDNEPTARFSNKCCQGDCHDTKAFINVTPYAADATLENRKIDWTLGIQGYVCCGRYEFVRSLSREWWIRKLAIIDNWSKDKIKQYLTQGSWHKTFDEPKSTNRSKVQIKNKLARVASCPQCGSKWNEVACDDCGYSE